MPVEIKTYQPASAKIKALVYGPSGIGKTTLGATAPKPLFISAEAGLLSVADKNVNYAEIRSLQDLRDVYAYLQKGGHGYETVVIDSLTEIQTFIIRNITGGQRMPQKTEWSDFGFEMTKILRAYRDLPMHVIFLALETDKGGEEEGDKSVYMPDLYGKVRTAAAAFMDFVGRMSHYSVQEGDAKVSKRGICFRSNERFIAKDRSGKLPALVEADFTKMLELIGTIQTGAGTVVASIDNTPADAPSTAHQQGLLIDLMAELKLPASTTGKWPPTYGHAKELIEKLKREAAARKQPETGGQTTAGTPEPVIQADRPAEFAEVMAEAVDAETEIAAAERTGMQMAA